MAGWRRWSILRSYGLGVVDSWVDDMGWPVELWSDGRQGRALVMLAVDDAGALLRCLIFARSPASKKS